MARPTITIPAPSQAPTPTGAFPDSPRAGSESPPPDGPGGELELELLGLTHALYNLGTTAVLDLTRDQPEGGKPVGARVNDVVKALAAVDRLSDDAQRVMIPIEVLREIDAGANPSRITSQRIERAVGENQFMNGKITAVQAYAKELNEALVQSYPDLAEFLMPGANGVSQPNGNTQAQETIANGVIPS